jgi:hypothetical protein
MNTLIAFSQVTLLGCGEREKAVIEGSPNKVSSILTAIFFGFFL